MRILTLLTDFGMSDHYVAAVKGAVLSRLNESPGNDAVQIVDITHEVAPGDVEAGAFLLGAVTGSFPGDRTVHLVVVDPGVGSSRRLLAVRSSKGVFLGPDNGVLEVALAPTAEVRSIERPDLWTEAPGNTFHGRDRLAPVAAHLLGGGSFEALGPEVEDPVRLERRTWRFDPKANSWSATVVQIDRFGNLITDLPADRLPEGPLEVRVGAHVANVRVACYADLEVAGDVGILVGSSGTLELAMRERSLARAWGVERGAQVRALPLPAIGLVGLQCQQGPPLDEGLVVPASSGGKEPSMSTTWEYHIINVRSEGYRLDPNAVKELNRLGAEGWELVSVTSVNFKTGATDNIAMVFKRPRGDA